MGQELGCTVRLGKRRFEGKAYLETDFVLFRGEERLKIPFQSLTNVSAAAGVLRLEFEGGPAEFELGSVAEKWARKILHPPSRLDKLGVKPGAAVLVEGGFDREFLAELAGAGIEPVRQAADLVLLAVDAVGDLHRIGGLSAKMKPAGAIWAVYPKGRQEVREIDVIEAGRGAGLKDTKVIRFSESHTALRFVRPVTAR